MVVCNTVLAKASDKAVRLPFASNVPKVLAKLTAYVDSANLALVVTVITWFAKAEDKVTKLPRASNVPNCEAKFNEYAALASVAVTDVDIL